MTAKSTAFAAVELMVRVRSLGSWGEEFTVGQIRDQAAKAAVGKLMNAVKRSRDFEIVGTPVVSAIVIEPEK